MDRPRILLANHDTAYLDRLSAALTSAAPMHARLTPLKSTPGAFEKGTYDAVVCALEKEEELEVLFKIRKRDGRLPIVALIEPVNGRLAPDARAAGASIIVRKSPDVEATADRLRLILQLVIGSARASALCSRSEALSADLRDLVAETRRLVREARAAAAPDIRDLIPVLVVEPDDATATLLVRSLRSARFGIPHRVRSAEEALAVLTGHGPLTAPAPELILLDPRSAGFDVLHRLKEAADGTCRVPVIVYSNAMKPEDERRVRELGCLVCVFNASSHDGMKGLVSRVRGIWRALSRS